MHWFRRAPEPGGRPPSEPGDAHYWASRGDDAFDGSQWAAAVAAYRRSLALTSADDPDHDERMVNMALSLSQLGQDGGDVAMLDEAISCFDLVLARTAPGDERLGLRRTGIAVAMTVRGHLRASADDLARADASVALIPEVSTQLASAHALIADEWAAEFRRTGALADLDRVVEERRLAVATSASTDSRTVDRTARYALDFSARAAWFGDEEQRAVAATQLRRSRDEQPAGPMRDTVILALGTLLSHDPAPPGDPELDEIVSAADVSMKVGANETELATLAIVASQGIRRRYSANSAAAADTVDRLHGPVAELLGDCLHALSGPDRVSVTLELAALWSARSGWRGDAHALGMATDTLQAQIDLPGGEDGPRASELHRQLAAAHATGSEQFGKGDLGAAVAHAETAVRLARSDDLLIGALQTLGRARLLAALASADYGVLNGIFESCYQRAITLSGGVAAAHPGLLNDAAVLLREAGTRNHDAAALDEAIALLRASVAIEADPAALTNLANALGDRYAFDSDLSLLDEAVEVARAAVEGTSPGHRYLASRLANLGHQLVSRYQTNGSSDDDLDLDEAIAAYLRAITVEQPQAPAMAGHVAALATAALYRYLANGDRKDLALACRSYAGALDHTPAGSSERPRRLAGLAAGLTARWEADHEPADLDMAIESLSNALALASSVDASRVNLAARLGDALAHRSRRHDDTDAEQARRWFTHALELAEQRAGDFRSGVEAARFWQSWATGCARWQEAADAGRRCLRMAAQIDRGQVTRADRETSLRRLGVLAADTAYALVQLNEHEAAATTIESSRAVLLSDFLELDAAELARLASGSPEIAATFREADQRRRALLRPRTSGWKPTAAERTQARSTRADYDAALVAVRAVPGYASFRSEPTFTAIAAAADRPVVYLVPARAGGLALVVANGTVDVLELPHLTHDRLGPWTTAYIDTARASAASALARPDWRHVVGEVCRWLWDVALGPVVTAVGAGAHVHVVPVGALALLPVHLAWTPDDTRPTRRRYALDELTMSFAPNARSLSARGAATGRPRRALAIVEPRPVSAGPLPGARFEALALATTSTVDVTRVEGGAATRRRFRREAARADLLHLACHAFADLDNPLDSGLLLADGPLRLRDLLGSDTMTAQLAVLSACGSGVVGARIPDESVGLPAALVQAGVAGVIATQWPVSDRDAAMLMAEFYQRWQWGAVSAGYALRASQQWQRDTTNAEKRETWTARAATGTLPEEVAEYLVDTTLGLEPDEREHADVDSWGAFTHTGA